MFKLKKILIVDDDDIVRFLAKQVLEETNLAAEVEEAINGAEALDYLSRECIEIENCPDLILLDIRMPIVDGLEFLERIQELPPTKQIPAKIIMVSSSSQMVEIEKAKKLGAVDYIVKPLTAEKIIEVVDRIYNVAK